VEAFFTCFFIYLKKIIALHQERLTYQFLYIKYIKELKTAAPREINFTF